MDIERQMNKVFDPCNGDYDLLLQKYLNLEHRHSNLVTSNWLLALGIAVVVIIFIINRTGIGFYLGGIYGLAFALILLLFPIYALLKCMKKWRTKARHKGSLR